MKKFIILLSLMLLTFSCANNSENRTNLNISGQIKNAKNGTLTLYPDNGRVPDSIIAPITTVVVDTTGTFTIKINIDSTQLGKLVYKEADKNYIANIFAEQGDINVKLELQKGSAAYGNDGILDIISLSGTKNNEVLMNFRERMTDFHATVTRNFKGYQLTSEIDDLTSEGKTDALTIKKLEKRRDSLMTDYFKQMTQVKKDIYAETNGSLAALYLITSEGFSISSSPFFNEEEKKEFLRMANEETLNTSYYQVLLNSVKLTEEIFPSGTAAPAFLLKNEKGEIISLKDFKGKYVLLDFWAYYCGPCIKSFPKLNKVYTKYKSKGLEIISISADLREDRWQKALLKHQNPWVQLIDKAAQDNPKQGVVSKEYNIPGLPTYCLIDKEGNVVIGSIKDDLVLGKIEEIFQD